MQSQHYQFDVPYDIEPVFMWQIKYSL